MTTEISLDSIAEEERRGAMFLGFGTVFRKELLEWRRGRAALIVGALAVASAIFTTLIPFVVEATGQPAAGPPLSDDPTTNVLFGWNGALTYAMIAVLATMALITAERDRGTLAWSLSNPVSPAGLVAAKFSAAVLVLGTALVVVPLTVSVAVATIAYGGIPNLGTVALFAGLFLTMPAFYIGLTVALGTFVRSTAGVAGIAFMVMFLPALFGSLLPIINEVSPTSIGVWAYATATGAPASTLTLVGWAASMVILAIGAKLVFDRQEF